MRTLKTLLSLIVLAIIMSGCAYNWIVEEEVIDPGDPDAPDVSFSAEIAPIFDSKCTTCHYTGNQNPDLTPANAYNSINSNRYVNTSDPESSLIYTKPLSSHSQTYSTAEAALVLTWITQGAQNN
nr:hypothetical protein [uncultured Draconibacterium sp.]